MSYSVVIKNTNKELTYEQKMVFRKLLSAYGPKRASKNAANRWVKAYALAQRDFEDIYGITPEVVYRRNKNE